MKEDFLHYLWKFKKFDFIKIQTTSQHTIDLVSVGQHNYLAGPDFFNASLCIDGQLWAGNVEIHLKSSDWYVHGHETDLAYDNVILHVVWEHDVDIYRKNNTPIPTLELKKYVSEQALRNYQHLFANQSQKWINCENDLVDVPDIVMDSWLERLFFERLAGKIDVIKPILEKSKGDWEATLFVLLLRGFGTKINADPFQSLAEQIPFSIVRKCSQEPFKLESLFFGMGSLLPLDSIDSYPLQLINEFDFIKLKFKLDTIGVLPIQFFKLRPDNFPTIRLSQVAQLYNKHQNLFHKLMTASSIAELYEFFSLQGSPYWDTHYNFGKTQKKRVKKLTKPFVDLLIINTIIPLRFEYAKSQGRDDNEVILQMIKELKPESNTIIKKFENLRRKTINAQETQALLQLNKMYCSPNRCLSCAVGNYLMKKK